MRSQLNSARHSRSRYSYDDDDGDFGGDDSLLHALQSMGLRNSMMPMNNGMGMPMQRMGSASSGIGGGHGGRFTGEFMATRGAANGRPIYEGTRGGQYYMTPSGNKSYIRK